VHSVRRGLLVRGKRAQSGRQGLARCWAARIVQATPSKTAAPDKALRRLMVSASSATPIRALSTGTDNCTVPAVVGVMRTRTQYHST